MQRPAHLPPEYDPPALSINSVQTTPMSTPTIFRQASDLTTRQQVWVSSVPSADPSLEGCGYSAAQIAGVWADTFNGEAVAKIPSFE